MFAPHMNPLFRAKPRVFVMLTIAYQGALGNYAAGLQGVGRALI